MITAQSRLGEVTAQSRLGHSSVTARSQLNHGIFSMITAQSRWAVTANFFLMGKVIKSLRASSGLSRLNSYFWGWDGQSHSRPFCQRPLHNRALAIRPLEVSSTGFTSVGMYLHWEVLEFSLIVATCLPMKMRYLVSGWIISSWQSMWSTFMVTMATVSFILGTVTCFIRVTLACPMIRLPWVSLSLPTTRRYTPKNRELLALTVSKFCHANELICIQARGSCRGSVRQLWVKR